MADNADPPARGPSISNRSVVVVLVIGGLMLVAYAWSVDYVTISGERAIYTADCTRGTWLETIAMESSWLGIGSVSER